MGYDTRFTGKINVEPPFTMSQADGIRLFTGRRHTNGPSAFCQWRVTADGSGIEWDGTEKFVGADEWMKIFIDKFVAPNGQIANGTIDAEGEEPNDIWRIVVYNNDVRAVKAVVTWPDDGDDELGEEDLQVEWPDGR